MTAIEYRGAAAEEAQERRRQLTRRWEALASERASWLSRWRDIAQHQRPHGFREHRSDANKGDNKYQRIINFTPIEAARTLASGMMAGITSPSRPWFRLTLSGSEPRLSESPAVKWWLTDVERRLRETLAKSNLYKCLHLTYADEGPFGTSCMLVEEDDEDEVRGYVLPIGSYCLATSPRGDVDTVFRETSLTVDQCVRLFGQASCSLTVQHQYAEGQKDKRVDVRHAIYPNEGYQKGRFGASGKAWTSCWWESASSDSQGFLRESGFDEFPCCAPRWEVTGEDVYGHGPGDAAQGDCRALQLLERRSAQAAEKHINPPMAAPASARNSPITLLPGQVTFVDALGTGQSLRPAVQVDPRAIEVVELQKREYEKRIRKAYFADLWLLLSESTGQMTAREVSERREEKLLQLGTVLEALQDELLDPLISRVFNILQRRGRLPPAPKELQGKNFRVEYISIMAQAQKLLGTTGLERLAGFASSLGQVKPDVLDKVDFDQLVDEYADSLGVPPATIRTDEAVAQARESRAQAQAQQTQMAQAQQGADTAKALATAPIDMESPNALTELLRAAGVR